MRVSVFFKGLVGQCCEIVEAKCGAGGVAVMVGGACALNCSLEDVNTEVAACRECIKSKKNRMSA